MLLCLKKKRFDGEMALLYFGGYGLGRAWIEAIRTDQLYISGTTIPVSMVVGIAMALGSLLLWLIGSAAYKNRKKTAETGTEAQERADV